MFPDALSWHNEHCFRCESHAPEDVVKLLPACSNTLAIQTVLHPAVSPSGA